MTSTLVRFVKSLLGLNRTPVVSGAPASAESKPRWALMLGQEVLGELVLVGYETPWITADFTPSDGFERFKPYFDWCKQLDAHEDEEDWEPEISDALKAVIDEVHAHDGFQIRNLADGKQEKTLLNFADDFSWASFR